MIEINNSIDEKIVGTNYLENIKFQLIEKLSVLEKNIVEGFIFELSPKKLFSNVISQSFIFLTKIHFSQIKYTMALPIP